MPQIHTGAKVRCRAGGNEARLGARVHVPVAILDQEFNSDTIGRLGTMQVKTTMQASWGAQVRRKLGRKHVSVNMKASRAVTRVSQKRW